MRAHSPYAESGSFSTKDSFQPSEYPYYWRVLETRDEYFDYYRGYHAFWKLYGIDLPDRQLACAPINSPEGQKYIAAMRAAANFAWCNRQRRI